MSDEARVREAVDRALGTSAPELGHEIVARSAAPLYARAGQFLDAASREGSPLYLFDRSVLAQRAAAFRDAFQTEIPEFEPFFAVKSNNCPAVARALVGCGFGLDVSSGVELAMALDAGGDRILFSGPGKTAAELSFACAHHGKVTVLMDSFGELGRLADAATSSGVRVRAGVRLTTQEHGLWRKFGIPLSRVGEFAAAALRAKSVDFCGLQFHTSWNMDPSAQVAFIGRLGETLRELPGDVRKALRFLDVGGGYWPEMGEWLRSAGTARGRVLAAAGMAQEGTRGRYRQPSVPIGVFAGEIGAALRNHVFLHAPVRVLAEPGRWLVNDCMHILLTVTDKKASDLVVVDAGTNIVGWERYEHDYFPVLNLTRPSLTETPCLITGSLCTPHDVWGDAFMGEGIEEGDVLLIPFQGAYTYSLRQQFIKPLAKVVEI